MEYQRGWSRVRVPTERVRELAESRSKATDAEFGISVRGCVAKLASERSVSCGLVSAVDGRDVWAAVAMVYGGIVLLIRRPLAGVRSD